MIRDKIVKIGDILRAQFPLRRSQFLGHPQDRRLEARKAEIAVVLTQKRPRQGKALGASAPRMTFDLRAAGIAETK